MSGSQIFLRDLRDLQTEMRTTEFASEPRRNFLIGLCNRLYPMLDIELLKKACPQVISAESDWLFKGSKTYRLFFCLQAIAKLTANYSEVLRIEPLEQSTVNLLYLACSTRILHRKLFTSLSCYHLKQLLLILKAFVF